MKLLTQRATHIIDAKGKVAGRLASTISKLLQGKTKATWEPHTDSGDYVRIQNVTDMIFTGKKLETKLYHRATGYPGNLKTYHLKNIFAATPDKLLRGMVYRMLPKNKLRDRMIKRLLFEKKS